MLSSALLVTYALLAMAASLATAAEPAILVLAGEKISELKYEGTASSMTFETPTLKAITCTKATISATFKALAGKEADAEAGTGSSTAEGCKQGKVACRSETAKGEKDPVETILAPASLTLVSEEGVEKALRAGIALAMSETLFLNCGGVKNEGRGGGICPVSPALTEVSAGSAVTPACKADPNACVEKKATCEKVAKGVLEGNLGAGFEAISMESSMTGIFNKMIFIDD